ncbi:MAG TPA: hexose kinase [Hanamia sp.]|nr:hexose kinase [Hanamia sp.]
MPQIVTITFNPAIDKSTTISSLIPEKKLKCTPPVFEPGGGGINVARAIKKLGGNATAIYLAGGYSGKFLNQLLDEENIPSIVIETKHHSRENLIVLDNSSNLQYRFGMPGPVIYENEWKKVLSVVEELKDVEYIVASGSLPSSIPKDIFANLSLISRSKNAKFIVDTSGEALQYAVNQGVYLLKPNLSELSALAGREELNGNQVQEVARQLIQIGKCEVIVVSLGAMGAMLITETETHQIIPPPVKKASTVGAGDSMLAGIVLSLAENNTLLEAAQYGVACGTAACMTLGTQLCRLSDVEKLYAAIKKEKKDLSEVHQ